MDSGKSDMAHGLTAKLGRGNFDNSLQFGCLGYVGSENNGFRSNLTSARNSDACLNTRDDECALVLGLGPSPSASYPKSSYLHTKKGSMMATSDPLLSFDGDSILQLCLSRCRNQVSNIVQYSSGLAESYGDTSHHCDRLSYRGNGISVPSVDEGSTSKAKKSAGFFIEPRMEYSQTTQQTKEMLSSEPSVLSDYSRSTISVSATTMTSADRRIKNTKRCKYDKCNKGARGATGLCIGHGGGQRCQKPGCDKGAENRTSYCKAHGGGKRCHELGCMKSAKGRTDYCFSHGGGRRCGYPDGCSKEARGKSGLCITHGGGKRCKVDGCRRSGEGLISLCISHGGGRRCQAQGCDKGSQGSTMLCKAHGGGKRCTYDGCTKGAEGSTPLCKRHGGGKRCRFEDDSGTCKTSVHGATNFCVKHGGGKRCVAPGCKKSARGRTDCCVNHGGGKRCIIEKCGKAAQGRTDFCKAHGGGRRCNWGESQGKCEKFARGKSGMCASHNSMVSSTPTIKDNLQNDYFSSKVGSIPEYVNLVEKPCKESHLLPIQGPVPVPIFMEGSSSWWRLNNNEEDDEEDRGSVVKTPQHLVIPEGRVHGGGLMSLFGGSLKNAVKDV